MVEGPKSRGLIKRLFVDGSAVARPFETLLVVFKESVSGYDQ